MSVALQSTVFSIVIHWSCIIAMFFVLSPTRFFKYLGPVFFIFVPGFYFVEFFIMSSPSALLNTYSSLLYYLFILVCFENPLREKLAAIILYSGTGAIYIFFFFPLLHKYTDTVNLFTVPSKEHLWFFLLECFLLVIFSALFSLIFSRASVWRKLPMKISGFILLVELLSTIFLDLLKATPHYLYACSIVVSLTVISICTGFAVLFFTERNFWRQTYSLLKQQQRLQLEYYHLQQNENVQLRKFSTDILEQITHLENAFKKGDSSSVYHFLSEIDQRLCFSKNIFSSGNHSVDALLQNKFYAAKQAECILQASLNLSEDCGIRNIDLVCILGNLIDNALHSIQKNELLKISGKISSGVCVLVVQNPYHGNEVLPSVDRQPHFRIDGHGIGLASVYHTVQRYQGRFTLQNENGWITARVILFTKNT